MTTLLIIAYFGVLVVLALQGLHRLRYLAAGRPAEAPAPEPTDWPEVLVQLPMYNEAWVARRVIEAAGRLDYPRDRLTIQVLDDSTDGTRAEVDAARSDLARQGVRVEVVRRAERAGFKAGALAHGSRASTAPLIAIFDADFLPPPDFLRQAVPPLLADAELGLVQARWGHLNRDARMLTRAQAVFLDGHFAVEHAARDRLGHPFNFNGTAGVWRRAAIEDAGGWEGDTLTEDLDLSYRAQLAGWRFAYVHHVVAPAELPDRWAAFRSQQARWVRGSMETARKLGRRVATAEGRSLGWRLAALHHLFSNLVYLFMAALAMLLPPTLVLREELGWRVPGGRMLLGVLDYGMLGAGTLAMLAFWGVAAERCGAGRPRRIVDLGAAFVLGAGMSLANAAALVQGFARSGGEFVRTPKRGGAASSAPVYRAHAAVGTAGAELVLSGVYALTLAYALRWQVWGATPFLLLYGLGFGWAGAGTLWEALRSGRRARSALPELVEADDLSPAVGR